MRPDPTLSQAPDALTVADAGALAERIKERLRDLLPMDEWRGPLDAIDRLASMALPPAMPVDEAPQTRSMLLADIQELMTTMSPGPLPKDCAKMASSAAYRAGFRKGCESAAALIALVGVGAASALPVGEAGEALTDRELQSLRNLGNESEAAANEIARLLQELAECHMVLFEAGKLAGAALAVERERCAKLCEVWMAEAERLSGPEAAGWLNHAASTIRGSGATPTPEAAPSTAGAERLLAAGRALSNIAFNLAQHPGKPLDSKAAHLMDKSRREWDDACSEFRRSLPAVPHPATESKTGW